MKYSKKWYIPGSSKFSDIFCVICLIGSYIIAYVVNKEYGIDQIFLLPFFVLSLFGYAYGYYIYKNKQMNTENTIFHFGRSGGTINKKNYKISVTAFFIGSTFFLLVGLYALFN